MFAFGETEILSFRLFILHLGTYLPTKCFSFQVGTYVVWAPCCTLTLTHSKTFLFVLYFSQEKVSRKIGERSSKWKNEAIILASQIYFSAKVGVCFLGLKCKQNLGKICLQNGALLLLRIQPNLWHRSVAIWKSMFGKCFHAFKTDLFLFSQKNFRPIWLRTSAQSSPPIVAPLSSIR